MMKKGTYACIIRRIRRKREEREIKTGINVEIGEDIYDYY